MNTFKVKITKDLFYEMPLWLEEAVSRGEISFHSFNQHTRDMPYVILLGEEFGVRGDVNDWIKQEDGKLSIVKSDDFGNMVEVSEEEIEYVVNNPDGSPAYRLNPSLIKEKKVSHENLLRIVKLHEIKLVIEDYLDRYGTDEEKKDYGEFFHSIEFSLQDLWGFPRNIHFHAFWKIKGCQCPKMDNQDAYPSGHYVKVKNCPYHGF